jgi:hypothetical protein
VPLLMTSLPSAQTLSNTELTLLAILTLSSHSFEENEAFIAASGYTGSASLKTSHPCGLPL